MALRLVPKAIVNVPDPDEISNVDLIEQVLSNIQAQILSLEQEISNSSQGDVGQVFLFLHI